MENIKKRWSTEEIEILQEFYSCKGPEFCRNLLKERTLESIKLKAQRLRINRVHFWTQEELDILHKIYPILGNYECQKLLPNRTYNSINLKASELGIKGDSRLKSNTDYDDELFNMQSEAYRIEDYITTDTPILHECVEGHRWKTRPSVILRGSGCPKCAKYGFNPSKPAILYYIKVDDSIYKIGITNNTVEYRLARDMSRIKIIWIKNYEIGQDAKDEEQRILIKFEEYKINIPNFLRSGGNTELFKLDIMSL